MKYATLSITACVLGLALSVSSADGQQPEAEPKPFHRIADTKTYQGAVMVGTIAIGASPHYRAAKVAVSVAPAILDGMTHAADQRGSRLKAQLILIDQDAARLKQLHKEGRELRTDDEAQRIIGRLMDDKRQHTTTGFLVRSIASKDGAMATVRVGGASFLEHALGKAVAKPLKLNRLKKWKVKQKWLKKELGKEDADRLRKFFQGNAPKKSHGWKRLVYQANAVKLFHEELAKFLVKKLLHHLMIKAIDDRIARRWEEIQVEMEAEARRNRAQRVTPAMVHLRLVTEPQIVIPAIVAEAAPLQVAEPLVIPTPSPVVYVEPLVRVAETQKSVCIAVEKKQPRRSSQPTPRRNYRTYNRPTSSSGGDSSGFVGIKNPDYWETDYWENNHWTNNNISHPTRNSSGISYDPGSNFRGNWDGGISGSFWSK